MEHASIADVSRETVHRLKEAGTEIGGGAAPAARGFASVWMRRGEGFIEEQKHRLASRVQNLSGIARDLAEKSRQEELGELAGCVETLAEKLHGVGAYLDQKSLKHLVRDVERQGRERPLLFLGALSLAGIMLGRMAGAAASGGEPATGGEEYGGWDCGGKTE